MTDHNQPTGRFEDTVGYRALLGSVPPDDDTPHDVCGRCGENVYHVSLCRVPPGDDTPDATVRWTVDRPERDGYHRVGDGTFHILVPTSILDVVLPLLNRAEAAPDLTALPTAEQVKEWLRVRSRGLNYLAIVDVLAAVAALVRDTPEETDG